MGVFLLGAFVGGLAAFIWVSYRKAEQHEDNQWELGAKTRDWRAGLDAALEETGVALNTRPQLEGGDHVSDACPVYLTGFEY